MNIEKYKELPNDFLKGYPSPFELITILKDKDDPVREAALRQIIMEGIPFCFKDDPVMYEIVRTYIATDLHINPKQIFIIGSGKIGYSMGQGDDFGKVFSEGRDLDMTIISEKLLDGMKNDFLLWKPDYLEGRITPASLKQEENWKANIHEIPNNLNRGFLDSNRIPNKRKYSTFNKLIFSCIHAKSDLLDSYNLKKLSCRVYRDWDSFTNQYLKNFNATINSIKDYHLQQLRNSAL